MLTEMFRPRSLLAATAGKGAQLRTEPRLVEVEVGELCLIPVGERQSLPLSAQAFFEACCVEIIRRDVAALAQIGRGVERMTDHVASFR